MYINKYKGKKTHTHNNKHIHNEWVELGRFCPQFGSRDSTIVKFAYQGTIKLAWCHKVARLPEFFQTFAAANKAVVFWLFSYASFCFPDSTVSSDDNYEGDKLRGSSFFKKKNCLADRMGR